jgi:hypothetical protein
VNTKRRNAEREAYSSVPETCPHVDRALEIATDEIKKQTGALRDALIDALERAIDAEKMVDELEAELDLLRNELAQAVSQS